MKKAGKSSKKRKSSRNLKVTFLTIYICALFVLCALVLNYVLLPAFTFRSETLWFLLFGVSFLTCLLFEFWAMCFTSPKLEESIGFAKKVGMFLWPILVLEIVLFVCGQLYSLELFRANDYHNLVKIQGKEFNTEFEDISKNPSKFFTLDLDSSIRLGDQVIGNIAHPEWYNVDPEFNLINFRGRLYRLSPLVYDGLFKYIKAKDAGIPGYVLIDAQTQKSSFVTVGNPIRYSPSAFWGYNLERHLRSQYPTYIFEKSFLEIDEDGVPYYVTGVLTPKIGVFGGKVMTAVIITDACTGESVEYKIEEVPSWVDHVFTLDYLEKMAFWYFEYIDGFWNSVFSKTNVNRTSYFYRDQNEKKVGNANFYGYNSFVLKNGAIAFISGITPANASEVNKGFISMNCKTGEIIYYAAPGSEESRVQYSAQAIYQNYGYVATYPTVVNYKEIPTYLLALKNNAGLIQRYAFVRVSDYNVIGAGETIEEALKAYSMAIEGKTEKAVEKASSDTTTTLNTSNTSNALGENRKLKFKIKKKYSQMLDGTTYYYYVNNGKVYRASAKVNELQAMYQIGDEVTITYVDGSENYAIIRSISK